MHVGNMLWFISRSELYHVTSIARILQLNQYSPDEVTAGREEI